MQIAEVDTFEFLLTGGESIQQCFGLWFFLIGMIDAAGKGMVC